MKINGMNVKDATRNFSIEIKPIDIRNGANKDPGSCAAANACVRQLHAVEARVHIGRVYLKLKGKDKKENWFRFSTPKALRDEIIAFDRGGEFMPGKFTLIKPIGHKLDAKKPKGPKIAKGKPYKKRNIVVGVRQHGANR